MNANKSTLRVEALEDRFMPSSLINVKPALVKPASINDCPLMRPGVGCDFGGPSRLPAVNQETIGTTTYDKAFATQREVFFARLTWASPDGGLDA